METNANAKEYPHFTRSYNAELAFLIFFCPVLFALWSFAAYYYYYSGTISAPLVKSAAYYSAAFAFALVFYGNARAVMKSKAVVVDGERVIKKGGGGASAVYYADIAQVRRSKIPLAMRWMVLETKSGSAFPLPLYIRGGYEMVDRVFLELERRGISADGAAKLRHRFRDASMRYNALQGLRAVNMLSFATVAAAAAVFNGAVAALFWGRGLIVSLSWAFVGVLFQALAYFASERLHTLRLFGRGGRVGGAAADTANATDAADTVSAINAGDSFSRLYAVSALAALFATMITGILITVPE